MKRERLADEKDEKTRQTTAEALDPKTLYLDAKEGGMKWMKRTEVWRVK